MFKIIQKNKLSLSTSVEIRIKFYQLCQNVYSFDDITTKKITNRVKMNFKCCICGKLAACIDLTINHLKNDHKIKSNSQRLECIVNNSCSQKYSNYKSLRKHVDKCVTSSNISEWNILPTSVTISTFILLYHQVHILIIGIAPFPIGKSNSGFQRMH